MEVGNCSLLDEATAAAEAMLMMYALRSREKAVEQGRNILFVDETHLSANVRLAADAQRTVRHRNRLRQLRRVRVFRPRVRGDRPVPGSERERSAITTISPQQHTAGALRSPPWRDILALALLKAPGEWGADIAGGIDPTVRPSDGIRRPARRFPDYEGRL